MARKFRPHHKHLPRAGALLDQGNTPLDTLEILAREHPKLYGVGMPSRILMYKALYARNYYEPVQHRNRKSPPKLEHLYPAIRDLLTRRYTVKSIAEWLHTLKCGPVMQVYGVAYRLRKREFSGVALRLHYIRPQDLPKGWSVNQPSIPTVDFSCD